VIQDQAELLVEKIQDGQLPDEKHFYTAAKNPCVTVVLFIGKIFSKNCFCENYIMYLM
jgi:hypothetical protein